jgi:hypothetical protein
MQRTPETDPALRTGGAAPAWTQLPQLNAAVSPSSPAVVAPWWRYASVLAVISGRLPSVFGSGALQDALGASLRAQSAHAPKHPSARLHI